MKILFGLILVSALIFGGYLIFGGPAPVEKSQPTIVTEEQPAVNNVTVVDGKQIVEIKVKGGYQPRVSTVKAGIPTTIRFNTSGTFDCSSAVLIPSMNISKSLPPTGATDIALGTLEPGTLNGMCGMGMYRFQLDVQS